MGKLELRAEHLASVTKKQILLRMLSNLLGIYSASDHSRALAAIERILLIDPYSAPHIRDRGLLLNRVGDRTGAITELERYLRSIRMHPTPKACAARLNLLSSQARLN